MSITYNLGHTDAVLEKTRFSFDVSVWEFFWTLLVGSKLILARPNGHQDADYLATIIRQRCVTVAHFVPSMLGVFLEGEEAKFCSSLTKIFCSGEALPEHLVKHHKDLLGAYLYNLYGPTEATVDVTAWDCSEDTIAPSSSPPIGRPISNTRIYLLDFLMNPVPEGVSGEICIGGAE